jgi:hypothetical protein
MSGLSGKISDRGREQKWNKGNSDTIMLLLKMENEPLSPNRSLTGSGMKTGLPGWLGKIS